MSQKRNRLPANTIGLQLGGHFEPNIYDVGDQKSNKNKGPINPQKHDVDGFTPGFKPLGGLRWRAVTTEGVSSAVYALHCAVSAVHSAVSAAHSAVSAVDSAVPAVHSAVPAVGYAVFAVQSALSAVQSGFQPKENLRLPAKGRGVPANSNESVWLPPVWSLSAPVGDLVDERSRW